uniref:Uncharacterized protein n=1 Tax=Cannabis sativa TaxID=3483 RepID=A0A803QSU4_CANSA
VRGKPGFLGHLRERATGAILHLAPTSVFHRGQSPRQLTDLLRIFTPRALEKQAPPVGRWRQSVRTLSIHPSGISKVDDHALTRHWPRSDPGSSRI